jgi:hypothetical protein
MTQTRIRPQTLLGALALVACCLAAFAADDAGARVVHFRGQMVEAPRSWPVLRLSQHPHLCVRLDRRAVYLGTPARNQRCPAQASGRRRAIVVPGRSATRPSVLARAGRAATASAGGAVFTGLGFDACTTPSSRTMAAWAASPYRAIGIYIGGVNRACSQPNLTAAWVSAQTAAGWHLIPTYVGLQAPTSSCSSCAKLSASQAIAQGSAAAIDAVAQASAVGIGPGSPIYFDMESYATSFSASGATLAFLSAWTDQLHSLGYDSGVYSSSASGIADIVDSVGSGYSQPDDLWIANWNGQQNTIDPYVPSNVWSDHQRIHQYRGGHDETYGGVTINIDNNYVDGATVGTAALPLTEDDPIGALDLVGSPAPGQVRAKGWALDQDMPSQPLALRAYVGGRAGDAGAQEYELGLATGARPDVARKYRAAGAGHGFDVSFPILKSGPQPVCVYALNTGPGADRLLGCKTASVPVPISFSHLRSTGSAVRVRVTCEWPAGTECPGQLAIRTRFKVAVRSGRDRPPRIRAVTRSLARRAFRLTGGQSHPFQIPLTRSGRLLLKERGKLRAELIAAIPGGRRAQLLPIVHRPR